MRKSVITGTAKALVPLILMFTSLRIVLAQSVRKAACPIPSFVDNLSSRSCKLSTSSIKMATNGADGSTNKHDKEELKRRLDPVAYHVTQERGTERAFSGVYYKSKEPGMYRCIVCDETLFKSDHKFNSGCGWPSFWDAADKAKVRLTEDVSHGMQRTEVTCAKCGAHLGHLFDDGPQPSGQRYCINSASLKFEGKK